MLALFLVDSAHGLGMTAGTATALVGAYMSACYLTTLPGGWVADRVLGPRRTALTGGSVILLGHLCLALDLGAGTIFTGLFLIAIGTGLQKPSMTAMVGTLYARRSDRERDAAYSRFYASINIGALVSTLIVGWFGVRFGWSVAFGSAAVGMTLSLVVFVLSSSLKALDKPPSRPLSRNEAQRIRTRCLSGAVCMLVLGLPAWGMGVLTLTRCLAAFTVLAVLVPVGYFTKLLRRKDLHARDRSGLRAYAWLFASAVVFWCISDLAASNVQLFTNDHVDMMGMPMTWQSALNPLLIIVSGGALSVVWRRVHVSAPAKFSTGLLLCGASFLLLSVAAAQAAGGARVSLLWLFGLYLLQTLGELFLGPTGLSISHKLAPAGMGSQLAALFYLAESVGDAVGGQVASRLNGTTLYLTLGGLAVGVGLGMAVAAPRVRALTGE
ncbi:MFS transporter [Streptomyces sp. AV19]|nr:MFS transporter [Streptomyces sp. AV19]